jgi:hypothetical protein
MAATLPVQFFASWWAANCLGRGWPAWVNRHHGINSRAERKRVAKHGASRYVLDPSYHIAETVMDKATIFSEVTRRNALRKANRLPPLDVPAEYAHQVAIAEQRDYQAACGAQAEEREAIRQQVLVELRAKHGVDFEHTMGGQSASKSRGDSRRTWNSGMARLLKAQRKASMPSSMALAPQSQRVQRPQ